MFRIIGVPYPLHPGHHAPLFSDRTKIITAVLGKVTPGTGAPSIVSTKRSACREHAKHFIFSTVLTRRIIYYI